MGRINISGMRNWHGNGNHWVSICGCILGFFCFIFLVFVASDIHHKEPYDDDLKTRLDELSKHVKENRELIANANARLNSDCLYHRTVSHSWMHAVDQLECGGYIRVPNVGHTTVFAYKSKELYNNNENCLWILDTPDAELKDEVRLEITLECEGFSDHEDSLSVLDWDHFDSFTSYPLINKGDKFSPEGGLNWVYLSFSTNHELQGHGFVIQIWTKGVGQTFMGSNWAFNTSHGNFVYGPNKRNDRVAVVINPKSLPFTDAKTVWELKATVDSRTGINGSCREQDSLFMSSVGLEGTIKTLARICGKSEAIVSTKDPIVVDYFTSENTTGTGFTLNWHN